MVSSAAFSLFLLVSFHASQVAGRPSGGSCPAHRVGKNHQQHESKSHDLQTSVISESHSAPSFIVHHPTVAASVLGHSHSASSLGKTGVSLAAKPTRTASKSFPASKDPVPASSISSSKSIRASKPTSAGKPASSAKTVATAALHGSSSYPFKKLVAFGDELSDNGNGSYAHGITGNPANVYGFGTWTDGPVAVSYLADLLGVPLIDYAFGGSNGGGSGGATVDNSYSPAAAQWDGRPVPSVRQQIYDNYTQPRQDIHGAMQFIMVGENDLSAHTDAFWEGDPKNADFADEIASKLSEYAEYLIGQGAPYVFVSNIYPKHKAPVTITYLCSDGGCVDTWGNVIRAANSAIRQKLAASVHANKIIYYDLFGYMMNLMEHKDSFGLTQSLSDFCDGDAKVAKWDQCIGGSYVWEGAQKFYWMNYIQPTTHVHRLIAMNMKATIDTFFSV